jgi:hypothetical protein
MTRLPDKINSSDPFAVAFNQLLDCEHDRTLKVVQLQQSCVLHAQAPETPDSAPGNFKGEWSPRAFAAGDTAKISNGIEAGTYVAMASIPAAPDPIPGNWPYYPWAGTNWSLVGRVNDQSSWL